MLLQVANQRRINGSLRVLNDGAATVLWRIRGGRLARAPIGDGIEDVALQRRTGQEGI
jgi:hypothetical protein